MPKPVILVDMDHVTIEGVKVPRPSHLARSAWMAYWEKVVCPREWR